MVGFENMETPASWHPQMPFRTEHGLFIYELDDSEKHWIVARSEDNAFKLFLTSHEYTREAYLDDYDELPEIKVLTYFDLLDLTVRVDDEPGGRKVPMKDVADEMTNPGMIASTVW